MQLFQFIGAALGSFVVVSVVSLVWPLVTTAPMPATVQTVRDILMQTSAGKEASVVLGVEDPTTVTPVNVQEFVSKKATAILGAAENTVKQTVTTAVITQVLTRFQELPDDQKQVVRESICITPMVE
ncbi:MAG: hypothetical protein AAB492_00985 [Patescibacteria group bacterium]